MDLLWLYVWHGVTKNDSDYKNIFFAGFIQWAHAKRCNYILIFADIYYSFAIVSERESELAGRVCMYPENNLIESNYGKTLFCCDIIIIRLTTCWLFDFWYCFNKLCCKTIYIFFFVLNNNDALNVFKTVFCFVQLIHQIAHNFI